MFKFKTILIVVGGVVVLFCGRNATATLIVGYNFDASTGSATTTATGLTASNFDSFLMPVTFVNGNPSSGKAIDDIGWKDAGNYFYYTVTPATGFRFSVANMNFDDSKQSGNTTNWQTYYKVGSASEVTSTTGLTHSSWTTNTAMSGTIPALQNLTNSVTFRIAATGASNDTNKDWALDNVKLDGETQARASLNTVVTTAPSAKVLTDTPGVQYFLTTTNNALAGGTIAAQTLDYTLGLSSATGLSFAGSNSGSGIARNSTNNNTINVNTSTSGTKGGSVVLSSSSNAWSNNLPAALTPVDVYQPASRTVNGGTSLQIANDDTSDGGQRAAARLAALTKTGGDSALSVTGLTAGGYGSGSVVSQNSSISGTPDFSGNVLNGTYSAEYQLTLEHNDQTITGTSANDLGTFSRTVFKNVVGNSGNQSVTLDAGRDLTGLWATSDKGIGSVADLLDGTLSLQRTISTSWRDAVPGEGPGGMNLPSDVLTLSGLSNETYVLQMNYDDSLLSIPEESLFLGWKDGDGQWVNAVLGNIGGTPSFMGDVAYNPSFLGLGNYGLYTASNVVWAVINHGGEFAVVPEPAAIYLLGLGLLSVLSLLKECRA